MKKRYLLYDFGEYEDREYWLVEIPQKILRRFVNFLKKDRYQEPIVEIDKTPTVLRGVKKITYQKYLESILPEVKTEQEVKEEIEERIKSIQAIREECKGGGVTGSFGNTDLNTELYWNEQKEKERRQIEKLLNVK